MGKLKKSMLISLSALFVLTVAIFGIMHVNSAHAAEISVTVKSDGNGNVAADEKSGEQIQISAESGSSVELTASPSEGYVFAYWYEKEDTPLSYDEVYSYTIPAAETTLHAKFFKNNEEMTVTASDNWNKEVAGTYGVKNGFDSEYNLESEAEYAIIVEFVGEKWLSYSYNLSLVTTQNFRGSQIINVDGVKYQENSHKANTLNDSIALKTLGDKYHRVGITFKAPHYAGSITPKPTSIDFSISNFTLKNDSEIQHTNATVNFDARLGEAYYLPGVLNTSYTGADFIIAHGTKMENKDGTATISVPANLPVGFVVKPFEKVTSTIDPDQQADVHLGGIWYALGQGYNGMDVGTGGSNIIITFDEEGKVIDSGKHFETEIYIRLQEIAVLPKVSLTKTVGGDQQTSDPATGSNFLLPYNTDNNILFAIYRSPNQKEVSGEEFEITVNGEPLKAGEDTGEGAGKNGYTYVDGKYGFNLVNVSETTKVIITPNYGAEYVKTSYTLSFNISSPTGSLSDVVSPASAPITVIDDAENNWFFDPAYNGEGNLFAFSSPFTEKETDSYSVSQIGFKVKGTGVFQLEFYLDGPSKYSAAAYKIGSKIVPSTGDNFTSKDLGYNKGFINGVANNLAMPQTNISWSGDVTYNAPTISDTEKVKVLAGNEKWYTFTLGIEENDEVETQIWFAHGIYNGNDSEYNRLTIRNVAFVSGAAYADWGVEGADGQIAKEDSRLTVKGGTAGLLSAGTALNFTAKSEEGQHVYGYKVISGTLITPDKIGHEKDEGFTVGDSDIKWDTENAKFVSFEETYRYVVGPGYNKIVAVIAPNGTYAVRNGDKLYKPDEIQTAFDDAERGTDKNVVIVDNVTLNATNVPTGVNLIIPFNRVGDYYTVGTTSNAQTRVSWATSGIYKDPVYTITLNGENTLYGNLYVGGVLHYPDQSAQGHTSGAYSQLILNGNLSVESGGHFDVYGRVTGDGAIDVKSGGKLSQPFMITDYNGGTNTEASFNKGVTPFKMYAMINVQNKGGFTIHHGAELYGHASLYFLSSITTIDSPFISYVERHEGNKDYFKNPALIILNDEAKVHVVYDDEDYATTENGQHKRVEMEASNNTQDVGFTKMEITGNAYAGYMQFPMSIDTTKVYFSVPYNYDITLKSGQFDILYPYKLMPGASFTVDETATLVVRSEAGVQVYDSFYGPSVAKRAYPTGEQLIAAGYKPYADFVVNGTLELKEGATFVGTVQNEGTGTIIVGDNVKLSAELFDGVATRYSCNYTKYTLNAQIWDEAHGEMRTPEAGKTYKAAEGGATFTLPGIKFEYDANSAASGDHSHKTGLTEITTADVDGLKGAWVLEEHDHVYDWEYTEEDHPSESERVKTLTRQCTQTGCTEHDERKMLFTADELNLGNVKFKNSAVTESDIKTLLTAYYGAEAEALIKSVKIDTPPTEHGQNYTVTVTLNDNCFFWVNGEAKDSFEFRYNVEEADITDFTLSQTEKTYDGVAITGDIVNKVVAGGLTLDSGDYNVAITMKDGGANSANAGVYTVTVTGKNNFKGELTKEFTINRVLITIDIKRGLTATYAGSDTAPEIPAGENYTKRGDTVGGDVLQVTVRYKLSHNAWKAGSGFVLTADTRITNGNPANYNIVVNESSLTLTKKSVSLKISDMTSVYGNVPDRNWKLEGIEGFVGDFDERAILNMLNITCEVARDSEAGTYNINAHWKEGKEVFDNFVVTVRDGTYTVSPAEYADVVFEGETKVTYDGNGHSLTVKAPDGAVVEVTYKLRDGGDYAKDAPVDAGTYDVKAVITSDNYNGGKPYEITTALVIDPAAISEVEISGVYTYDGTAKQLEVTVKTENGLTLAKEDYSVECANYVNAQEAIEYKVTATGKNYTGAQTATFTIAKKSATVKINDQSKVYDAQDPELSQTDYVITGLIDNQDIGLLLTVSGGKDVNDYKISYEVTNQAVANNYNITYCTYDGKAISAVNYPRYSITPAKATVTVGNLTSAYGDDINTSYTFTSQGFLNDGFIPRLSYECAVQKGSPVGIYEIGATVSNEHGNYSVSIIKGSYEVTKRHIKITVNSGESVYGDAIPETFAGYTVSGNGRYGNDDLEITYITYAEMSDARTYTVGAKCGNKNYAAEITEGNWTITKKPVTGIMVIVSDGVHSYSDSGDGVIHAKFSGEPLSVSAGASQPYDMLHIKTSMTEITATGSYRVTAKISETNYSGEITVTVEVTTGLDVALQRLEELKASLGEELTADDFDILKQMSDCINALGDDDKNAAELDEYKQLIQSWNSAAEINGQVIEQANGLADKILGGLVAALSATAALCALAYVAISGGKAI